MAEKDKDQKIVNSESRSAGRGPAEVYAEKAESKPAELSELDMKVFAAAYARYLKAHDLEPGDATFIEFDEPAGASVVSGAPEQSASPASAQAGAQSSAAPQSVESVTAAAPQKAADEPVLHVSLDESEKQAGMPAPGAETQRRVIHSRPVSTVRPQYEEQSEALKRAEALLEEKKAAQAKADPRAAKQKAKQAARQEEARQKKERVEERRKLAKKKKQERKQKRARDQKKRKAEREFRKTMGGSPLSRLMDAHDMLQDSTDEKLTQLGQDFAKSTHAIASSYRNSRRSIGVALFMIGIFAAAILIIFDRFTIYEYAYNGKVLGYVKEQDEITDVLEVAGKKLTQNSTGDTGIEFVANQNITFNLVDARGKSTDDADTAVNKLIYLTDIETEAYGVYDGNSCVAIVKDAEDAETLLSMTKDALSTPDNGMELVSSEFTNELDIRPLNVLLNSVQSNEKARDQMINGGEMETYHIAEEDETAESIAASFGVDPVNIYNEDNSEVVTEIEQGDKVCIHSTVEPVNVKMVETGRMKEIIEYKTIKKKSDEYYQGDSHVEQEGINRVQIFEGTVTKIGGEVTDRKEDNIEVITKGQNKIILVGTKERPKTAPTGTYVIPIARYVVTSEFGGRWGRNHDGIDLGAGTGTPIYATDGGTVTRATYYSGYGLCVDIDHENGRMTRYGHCSKLLVHAGDRVYQGQEIALVGNTGHSFGSHLHFEVRINGVATNPRKYLKF